MKTTSYFFDRLFASVAMATLLAGFFVVAGCEKSSDCDDPSTNVSPDARPIQKNNLNLPFFVEGANQEWWNNLQLTDVLYEERQHNPILAPDGHHVTWAEFNRPVGTAKINCTGQGTRINLRIEGLIPNGVYSLFLQKF